jgi:hypothetical protein
VLDQRRTGLLQPDAKGPMKGRQSSSKNALETLSHVKAIQKNALKF